MGSPIALAPTVFPRASLWRPHFVVLKPLNKPASFDFLVVLILSGAALLLSLAHPWSHAYVGDAQYGDAAYWDFTGESWARGYFGAKAPDIRPGYSVFLGIIYSVFGVSFRTAFIAQAALYAVGVAMVFAIGKRIGGRLSGTLAAVLLVLDPYMWEWTATSTTELLGSIGNLAALFFLTGALRRPGQLGHAAASAACLAVANVVRPVSLPFVGVIVLAVALRQATWTWRAGVALAIVGAAGLALLPSVLYEYATTGDAGLSSNSAANLFAASSPTYRTWTPEIYADVGKQLTQRGVSATPENINAEFARLTIENYLRYPDFQLSRIMDGLGSYAAFEGETERPDQYLFYRPYVLVAGAMLAAVVALFTLRGPRRVIAVIPGLALAVDVLQEPEPGVLTLQAVGLVVVAVGALGIFQRPRSAAGLVVGAYWLATGILAILTTGTVGFFLNRLYTQVEPERALLLAVGTTWFSLSLVPSGSLARVVSLRGLRRAVPGVPGSARLLAPALGVLVAAVVLLGAARLTLANIAAPDLSSAYSRPSSDELGDLATRLGLPREVQYVTADSFQATYAGLVSGMLPPRPTVYAIPGQFTRFLWYLGDQDRTVYWYVFADHTRPASLDLTRVTAESMGHLSDAQFANQDGLLIVVTDSGYFEAVGDVAQQNVLTTRAFVPWDDASRRFKLEAPTVFVLGIPLYDHARFEAAQKVGRVSEAGPVRVKVGDPQLRALDMRPSEKVEGGGGYAAITYGDIFIPANAHLKLWAGLHPRFFGNKSLAHLHVQIDVISPDGGEARLSERELDPMDTSQFIYLPMDADLGPFAGQTVGLRLSLFNAESGDGELFIGEPRLVIPS